MSGKRNDPPLPLGDVEQRMADAFVAALLSGAMAPTVTESWYAPPPAPPPDASGTEFAQWLELRGQFLTAAPSILSEYLAATQGAIDDWDYMALGRTLLEARAYVFKLKELFVPDIERERAGGSVAELFRLEEGLSHARDVDLAAVRETRKATTALFDANLAGVIHVTRLAWRDGAPQKAAAAAPFVPQMGAEAEFEATLHAIAADLAATLRDRAAEEVPADPLVPDIDAEMAARLARPGRLALSHDDIPDRDLFYEFLAHRFAYEPNLPLFVAAMAKYGYSRADSYDFETRAGLRFTIVMPTGDRIGELPPVVVFRGTQVDDLNDIRTDLEFQIGAAHFLAVEHLGLGEMLVGAARDCGGLKPHITGHSLGGALAQLTAARWPDRVGAVITFQAPGLTRINHRLATLGFAAGAPEVRHYVADRDVVHLAGQRHLPGETVLVTGLHVDRGEGWVWGLGHSDLLLPDHRMRARLVRMGLAAIWSPHTLSGFVLLPDHPTAEGSMMEMARGGVSLSISLSRRLLAGPRDPRSVLGAARDTIATGLAQEQPSIRRGLLEVGWSVARSVLARGPARVAARLSRRTDMDRP